MSERFYTEAEIMSATHAAAAEIYGHDTVSAGIVAGKIAMQLAAGVSSEFSQVTESTAPDWDKPADYAARAIGARTSVDLVALISNGAQRLSKSAASYVKGHGDEGWRNLTPWVMAEGSQQGEKLIGRLRINVGEFDGSFDYVSISLQGGGDAPYNHLSEEKNPSRLVRTLSIKSNTIKDPVTNERVQTYYPELDVRYEGNYFHYDDGKLFEAKYGKPIGVYGSYVIADLFLALDSTITYYETVYSANVSRNGHIGLTYNDFKAAGCLDDELNIDREKADAYASAVWNAADDPELQLPFERKLVLDSNNRNLVEKHKALLRPTIAVLNPGLVSAR